MNYGSLRQTVSLLGQTVNKQCSTLSTSPSNCFIGFPCDRNKCWTLKATNKIRLSNKTDKKQFSTIRVVQIRCVLVVELSVCISRIFRTQQGRFEINVIIPIPIPNYNCATGSVKCIIINNSAIVLRHQSSSSYFPQRLSSNGKSTVQWHKVLTNYTMYRYMVLDSNIRAHESR
jgi:hypothetical protein